MQELIENIIEKLEESQERYDDVAFMEMSNNGHTLDFEYANGKKDAMNEAIEIVKQEAEQYNNGWISCSERLPEGRQDVLVCFDNIDCCIIAWYSPNGRTWRNSSTNNICKEEPIAWMNLPAPYQPKGE